MPRKHSPKPREVFVSHSNKDRRFAERIVRVLRDHGVAVWYSGTNIVGAKQWHDEFGKALGRCDWFIVILSSHSIKSEWVKRELLYALNDSRYNRHIIPISHKPCNHIDLSWTLGASQFVDFTTSFDEGCRSLLRIWGLGYQNKPKF
jgi:TIR domain-containing protein